MDLAHDIVKANLVYFVLLWIICGVLNYGLLVAHFQRKFPLIADAHKVRDRVFAGFAALTGPFGLVATFLSIMFTRGWKL